jgi:hypothetical protein
MRYEDTRFIQSAAKYTVHELLITAPTAAALLGCAVVVVWQQYVPQVAGAVAELGGTTAALAGAFLGIVVAGLAIVAIFTEGDVVLYLHAKGEWAKLLFIFWWDAGAAALSVVVALATQMASHSEAFLTDGSVWWLSHLNLLLFLYVIFSMVSLVGTVRRLSLYQTDNSFEEKRAEFVRACERLEDGNR